MLGQDPKHASGFCGPGADLSIYLSIYLSIHPSIHLSIYFVVPEEDLVVSEEDIVLPEGVEISLLTQEEPVNEPIVAVRLLRIAEEEIEPEADEEALEEGAEAEGEEGAEETGDKAAEGDTEENKE